MATFHQSCHQDLLGQDITKGRTDVGSFEDPVAHEYREWFYGHGQDGSHFRKIDHSLVAGAKQFWSFSQINWWCALNLLLFRKMLIFCRSRRCPTPSKFVTRKDFLSKLSIVTPLLAFGTSTPCQHSQIHRRFVFCPTMWARDTHDLQSRYTVVSR